MKVYIAAPWTHRESAKALARLVESDDRYTHVVIARWLTEDEDETAVSNFAEFATKSLDDIAKCDVFIALNFNTVTTGGGRHVELGYALSRVGGGLRIFLVGDGPNEIVFHHKPCVRHIPWYELLDVARLIVEV